MDIEYDGYAKYILPCVINVLSNDNIIVEFNISSTDVSVIYLFARLCKLYSLYSNLTVLQCLFLRWVCLYSEEKLQTMQNNLKIKTQLNGVKIIDYEQFRHINKYLLTR